MKTTLTSLVAALLLVSTLFLCACGTTTTQPPSSGTQTPGDNTQKPDDGTQKPDDGTQKPDDGTQKPNDGVIDVYDPSLPMADLSTQIMNYLYSDGGLLKQPTENVFTGTSTTKDSVVDAFVTAETIIARGRPDHPLYGIYTYTHEHQDNQDTMIDAGFTAARVSDDKGWGDSYQLPLTEAGMKIMTGCSVPTPFNNDNVALSYFLPQKYGDGRTDANMRVLENYDIASWLIKAIDKTREKIDRLGPDGSYWKNNPNVNYSPIVYFEYFNEPNFQYMIPVKKSDGKSDDANAEIKSLVYMLMHVALYQSLKPIYGDSVQFVGVSAGGGAGQLGKLFVETLCSYKNDARVTEKLNAMLDPDRIVQYAKESDADFAARKQSVRKLREYMGLADGTQVVFDLVANMDIMSSHPYYDGASPFALHTNSGFSQSGVLKDMRNAMVASAHDDESRKLAEEMPIWFTECGWSIKGFKAYAEAYPEDVANGIYGGQALETAQGTSQIIQAAMEVQDYLFGIRNGIDFISYMHMYDTDGCNYGMVNYGYKGLGGANTNNKTPRLTMYAIGTMTKILPNPMLVGVLHEGKVGSTENYIFAYEIEADIGGEIVTTVFSPLQATPATIEWEDDYALVTDMFGKSQIVKASGGYLNLEAGPYMLYVRKVPTEMLIAHGLVSDILALDIFSNGWSTKEDLI